MIKGALAGDKYSIGKLLSLLEDDRGKAREIMRLLPMPAKESAIIGFTGPAGAGKSTLVSQVGRCMAEKGRAVAILAVDPSSPFSGGAVLGDRIRMQEIAGKTNVYIRSLGSRGYTGGLSFALPQFIKAFCRLGFDTILIETVGAGQVDWEIRTHADTVVLVLVPGLGDEIQAMKAGLLEIADLFVVNKSDLEGVERLIQDLSAILNLSVKKEKEWSIPICKTVATAGEGIPELLAELERRDLYLRAGERRSSLLKRRTEAEIKSHLGEFFQQKLSHLPRTEWDRVTSLVLAGSLDSFSAAEGLWKLMARDSYTAEE